MYCIVAIILGVQRTIDIAMFNAKASQKFIYLLSTRAGGPCTTISLPYRAILAAVPLVRMDRALCSGEPGKMTVWKPDYGGGARE